jgi:ATP-binding cassette subfamily B protein
LKFDDSMSAVDTATEAAIRERLAQELKDTTKIIITQRLTSIEHADMIGVLREGAIQAVGRHEELLTFNPMYRDLYTFQQKGASA